MRLPSPCVAGGDEGGFFLYTITTLHAARVVRLLVLPRDGTSHIRTRYTMYRHTDSRESRALRDSLPGLGPVHPPAHRRRPRFRLYVRSHASPPSPVPPGAIAIPRNVAAGESPSKLSVGRCFCVGARLAGPACSLLRYFGLLAAGGRHLPASAVDRDARARRPFSRVLPRPCARG